MIASRPHLNIKMDIIHYPQVIACESNGTKTSDAASTVLAEWDVVTSSDVILAQTFTKTNNFIFQQVSLNRMTIFTLETLKCVFLLTD